MLAAARSHSLLATPAGPGDLAGGRDGPGESHGPAGPTKPGAADASPPAVPREEDLSAETRPAAHVNVRHPGGFLLVTTTTPACHRVLLYRPRKASSRRLMS